MIPPSPRHATAVLQHPRAVRRSIVALAAMLTIGGTPLVARALDDPAIDDPAAASTQPTRVEWPTDRRSEPVVPDLGANLAVTEPEPEPIPTPEPVSDPAPAPPPVPEGTSAEQWAALRNCESRGDYAITNPSGKYRGAYQFDRRTWNSVAERHAPHLVGVDPALASPADQDAMAFALYGERGARPWPHCGRHLR